MTALQEQATFRVSLLNDQERAEGAGDLLVTTADLRLTRLNAVRACV